MQFDLFDEDEKQVRTVSEINAEIREILEDGYADVSVVGEVSNFRRQSSGHLYFTLKDSEAQLRGICFRGDARNLSFDLEDGMQVIAHGRLTLYEAYGQFQMVVNVIEEAGVGDLERAFQKLKETLGEEGLFDAEHKQELPRYPFRIAVVTSPTGAAVRDIISTLSRRWPCADILVYPVRVQGDLAVPEIVRALERIPTAEDIDLVILGRGGGSLEDLWAFNEEPVARAIHACPLPIISAVGHETDFTIADFVADTRAATPTMAAEIAVPKIDDVVGGVTEAERRLGRTMTARLDRARSKIQEMLRSYALGQIRNRIQSHLQTHDYTIEKLHRNLTDRINRCGIQLDGFMTRLKGLDAKAVLSRGYAICADFKTGKGVQTADSAVLAGNLRVTFNDGSVLSEVKEKVDD